MIYMFSQSQVYSMCLLPSPISCTQPHCLSSAPEDSNQYPPEYQPEAARKERQVSMEVQFQHTSSYYTCKLWYLSSIVKYFSTERQTISIELQNQRILCHNTNSKLKVRLHCSYIQQLPNLFELKAIRYAVFVTCFNITDHFTIHISHIQSRYMWGIYPIKWVQKSNASLNKTVVKKLT